MPEAGSTLMDGWRSMTLSRLTIMEWGGANVLPESSALPPGSYPVEPIDLSHGDEILVSDLADVEEQVIMDALAELEAGKGIPYSIRPGDARAARTLVSSFMVALTWRD